MGISVTPVLASGSLPGAASAASAASPAAGEFAALLNGELLNMMGNAAGFDGAAATTADTVATDNGDNAENTSEGADTSLLASLFGHLAADAPGRTIQMRSATAGDTGERSDGKSIATAVAAEQSALKGGDPGASRAKPDDAELTFGKLVQSSMANAPANAAAAQTAAGTRTPAANIAGENAAGEAPTAVTGQLSANPLVASHETAAPSNQRNTVHAHLHSAAWPQQFGDKLVWLARNDQQTAQLNINPPQLGPIQITVNLSGDQASIAFASPHAEVRQAIESAMPQLKDMLSSAGINLGQSNVGANLSQQRADNPFADANGARSTDEDAILPANDKAANTAGTAVLHRGRGLVDLFA